MCRKQPEALTARDLFAYAFTLCEAHEHPERLERLFSLAAQMQDRSPNSRSFGNFWWSMSDKKVQDYNSVDFCMRGGSLLWLKDRDFIPAPAREQLEQLLDDSIQGCLHHKVDPSYSNIAIMNAGDLILLGEALGKLEVADEGYARLNAVFRYTQSSGVHEYDSPTYTGVDLDGLGMIEAFCRRDSGRAQARVLLELFWTDIALNWFPAAQKLAGAQSRTYDYPYGLGGLDENVALNGWLPPVPPNIDTIFTWQANWHPSEQIHELSNQFPRLVRQSWGADWWQSRTHYLLPDVTLSCAAAGYGGRMDMPLTVDLWGERKSVRGYFIADGRNDPYGKIPLPAGAHHKAFHLNPFWTAAQRTVDALGLVLYREKDIPANATTLVSDFVMPMKVDSIWIGERQIKPEGNKTFREPVRPGEALVLRKGDAVFGVRVVWSRGLDGREGRIFLIDDGNPYGALRLAVEHVGDGDEPTFKGNNAGAAFWVRIGSGLKTDAEFADWRRNFEAASATVNAASNHIQLSVAGTGGPVSIAAKAPWDAPETLEPAPTRAALELNGEDIGGKILSAAH